MGTAGAEGAAGDVAHQRGHDAGNCAERRAAFGLARLRDAAQQAAGIGVAGRGEDGLGRAGFDQFAGIHHRHLVGHARHDAKIVGDQDHRHVHLAREIHQKAQYLGLDGHVERGGGFVRDQQVGLAHQGHRDHHALPQPARQLVRILRQAAFGGGDADLFQKLHGTGAGLGLADIAVQQQGFHKLVTDGVGRVERGHRLLEDHGDAVSAQVAHDPIAGLQEVDVVIADLVRRAFDRLAQKAHHRERGQRLARAAFADDRQRLAALHLEVDAAHRVQRAAAGGDVEREVLYGKECVGHVVSSVLRGR